MFALPLLDEVAKLRVGVLVGLFKAISRFTLRCNPCCKAMGVNRELVVRKMDDVLVVIKDKPFCVLSNSRAVARDIFFVAVAIFNRHIFLPGSPPPGVRTFPDGGTTDYSERASLDAIIAMGI
jgi:hypothetical protein